MSEQQPTDRPLTAEEQRLFNALVEGQAANDGSLSDGDVEAIYRALSRRRKRGYTRRVAAWAMRPMVETAQLVRFVAAESIEPDSARSTRPGTVESRVQAAFLEHPWARYAAAAAAIVTVLAVAVIGWALLSAQVGA